MGQNSPKNKNDNAKIIYALAVIIIILSGALYLVSVGNKTVGDYEADRSDSKRYVVERPDSSGNLLPGDRLSSDKLPKLALIIDDIGFNKRYADLVEVDIPLTLAIIPFTPYSSEAAEHGGTAGMEIMLHLPMEPKGYPESKPGKGALLTTMNSETIRKLTAEALAAIPDIKGVNNHMGSRFTEYPEGMKLVLEEIKKRGLFFIDSKTSVNSTAFLIARKMSIKTAERSVFLDNIQTEEAIKKQLMEAIRLARENGEAIAIGHPYPATINVIKNMAPSIEDNGVKLVLASQIAK